jgi:CDP-diacylglycerol--glycerol-3-phosphate 3-phosphatidyltransferase
MMKNKYFTIPNILSLSRIVFGILLFFNDGNKYLLFTFLLLAGITDILDGYIARKYNMDSIIGSLFDSIADFILYFLMLIYFMVFEFDLVFGLRIYVIIIIIIKMLSLILGLIKYKKPGFLHTIGNKITGIIIYIGICFFVLVEMKIILNIALCISITFSLEELIINIFGKKYNGNIKSIYELTKSNK